MDGIGTTTTIGSSVGRYSLRSENKKFLSNDNDDAPSAIGNDSGGGSSDDPPLSEYELLRLRNIQRNETRLAQLGLLIPGAQAMSKQKNTQSTGSLTNLSPQQKSNKQNKRKKQDKIEPLPRRTLPKRHCTKSRLQGEDDCDAGYASSSSDESSIAASPIQPKRILTLQPHQAAVSDEAVRPRRESRGRPRLGEYVYVCEETCVHCGGEWKLDGNEEEEEEETKLIRCKGCRGAFHVQCMLLHGKSEDGDETIEDDDASSDGRKENISALESLKDDKEGQERDREDAGIVPKRCFQCECNKSKRAKRKSVAHTLEAIVDNKILSVKITPEPSLEAVVRGNNLICYITCSESSTDCRKK